MLCMLRVKYHKRRLLKTSGLNSNLREIFRELVTSLSPYLQNSVANNNIFVSLRVIAILTFVPSIEFISQVRFGPTLRLSSYLFMYSN